jgi:ferrous iron transport protein B
LANRFALVGAPNAGKTTLFNWLTDSHFEAVNYPGATVETNLGKLADSLGGDFEIFDTPGTYSLFPKSYDESIAIQSIYGHPKFGKPAAIIGIVDATQLSRHLFLMAQLKEAGFPLVLSVSNVDLLKARGQELDIDRLENVFGVPAVSVNGQTGEGVKELSGKIRAMKVNDEMAPKKLEPWSKEKSEEVFSELSKVQAAVISKTSGSGDLEAKRDAYAQTQKIDRLLLHPVLGLFIFFAFVSTLFASIFWFSRPLMDLIDSGFGWLGSFALERLPPGLFADFLSNALISGIGGVLVFLPQIIILFLGLTYFEDSGYLARAATLVDRPLSKIGLNGRSFVPLLSGYACAIPAMMATRTISGRKEKLITLFIIPLMSCSARLPVYALLLAFLLQGNSVWLGGLVLAGIYLGSLLLGSVIAALAAKVLRFESKSFFMLELPVYRRPLMKTVLKQTLVRTQSYITKAGPMILVLSMALWALTVFPNYKEQVQSVRLQTSYASQAGQILEPVLKPMGADWRVGVGLISAFAAREIFVSSLAVVFSIADEDSDSLRQSLLTKMREARASDGSILFSTASVVALILFFMIALQCMATFGVARREFGGWKWPLVQLVSFNALAYVLSVSAYQILK